MRYSIHSWFIQSAILAAVALSSSASPAAPPESLPGTVPLNWPEEDLSGRMMDGAHRFVEQQIEEALARRKRFWKYDPSSPAA
jgi:hypothetical protein